MSTPIPEGYVTDERYPGTSFHPNLPEDQRLLANEIAKVAAFVAQADATTISILQALTQGMMKVVTDVEMLKAQVAGQQFTTPAPTTSAPSPYL